MNTLREQQRSFAHFILADGDVQSASEMPVLKHSATNAFKDSQRLQVYRNNISLSLREALAGVYPVIKKLVGEEYLQYFSREYVQRYPSRTGNLHNFGDELASFLKSFPGLETLPYLPDVARLEWARHQVIHSAEGEVLNLAALAALDEKQMGELRFQVSPGCVCLASDYPVLRIWQENLDGQAQEDASISLDEGGVQLVVLRHGYETKFHTLSPGIFALIETLAENKMFAQACDAALEVEAGCDIAGALHYLVEQKIVGGFSVGDFN